MVALSVDEIFLQDEMCYTCVHYDIKSFCGDPAKTEGKCAHGYATGKVIWMNGDQVCNQFQKERMA